MKARRPTAAGLAQGLALLAAVLVLAPRAMPQAASPTPGREHRDADGFLQAHADRPLTLPADHGSHPDTRTEWWYLTGPLEADDGRRFGFQATWFRRALVADEPQGRSPLAVRDVMLFHGAITDVQGGALHFTEQASRAYGPWAGAAEDRLDVHLFGHAFRAVGGGTSAGTSAEARAGRATLVMDAGGAALDVSLDLAACEPWFHGEVPGLSIKGHAAGQAAWYYSYPRIPLAGTLTLPDGEVVGVRGTAWFDHEFGSSQLGAGQVGWDWFSVPLDDGSDLMLYSMRLDDGRSDSTSSGSFRAPGGQTRHLAREAFEITPSGSWTSPHTLSSYPAGWILSVPDEELALRVRPLLDDQEIRTPRSTGVTYWEGLCEFEGTRAGKPVAGRGYVELVGYSGALRERL